MSSTNQNFLNKKSLHCTTMTYQQIHSGKTSSHSTYLPSKFTGGLGRGCFALAFGTWHPNKVVIGKRPVARANNPNKRFFSTIFLHDMFTLTNKCNNSNLKHLKKICQLGWVLFPFGWAQQPNTNLKCYPFAVRETGMFLLVTSQTFFLRDVLIWSYVRHEHGLKIDLEVVWHPFLGCQMALWKERI